MLMYSPSCYEYSSHGDEETDRHDAPKYVLCTQPRDVAGLAPREYDGADTSMLLCMLDAVIEGSLFHSIRTNTPVVFNIT